MYIQLLKAKLHHARVTAADVNYVGSITIDKDLMVQVGIVEYERVQVVDVENGSRLETYVFPGARGSGTIQMNGAAARRVSIGDRIIIMAYAFAKTPGKGEWVPRVAVLDEHNRIKEFITGPQVP